MKSTVGTVRVALFAALLALTAGSAGCFQGHTIDSGLWSLRMSLDKYVDGKVAERGLSVESRVLVELEFEEDVYADEYVETVLAWRQFDESLHAESSRNLDPLTGTIEWNEQDPRPILRLQGVDKNWHFQLASQPIRYRDRVTGVISGTRRLETNETVQGRWEMEKVRE